MKNSYFLMVRLYLIIFWTMRKRSEDKHMRAFSSKSTGHNPKFESLDGLYQPTE